MRHSARKVLTGVMSNSSRGSRVARINKCVGGDARAKITIRIEKPQLVKYTEEILYLLLFEMYNLTQKLCAITVQMFCFFTGRFLSSPSFIISYFR